MVFRYFKYVFVHVFISVAYISRIVAFLISPGLHHQLYDF